MNATARIILTLVSAIGLSLPWPLWLRDWWSNLIPDFTDAHDIWADPFDPS